jgi:transposase
MVAGVDIGSEEHWVCGPARDDGEPNVRVFGTTTAQLEELAKWLAEQGVQSVAMESTSVYWIPLYELLDSRGIEAVLVNARQLHNVPGRKTDFHDCQWIQLLHSCGLLRGSFRPGDAVGVLRAVHRQLANLVEERTRCVQWMQKALDQMNVQIHRAVADLTGTTGMAIVRAIVAGERDPLRLATHRDPRCRKSVEQIAQHLSGSWRDEHLFNLASCLRLYDAIEELIASHQARLLTAMGQTPASRSCLRWQMHWGAPWILSSARLRSRGQRPVVHAQPERVVGRDTTEALPDWSSSSRGPA